MMLRMSNSHGTIEVESDSVADAHYAFDTLVSLYGEVVLGSGHMNGHGGPKDAKPFYDRAVASAAGKKR